MLASHPTGCACTECRIRAAIAGPGANKDGAWVRPGDVLPALLKVTIDMLAQVDDELAELYVRTAFQGQRQARDHMLATMPMAGRG